jgi:hypothetical protein
MHIGHRTHRSDTKRDTKKRGKARDIAPSSDIARETDSSATTSILVLHVDFIKDDSFWEEARFESGGYVPFGGNACGRAI